MKPTGNSRDEGAQRHAPATLRNRDPILEVLKSRLPDVARVLEIASGTGEHAAYMAPRLSGGVQWFPSDVDRTALAGIDAHARAVNCGGIHPARHLDVAKAGWEADAPDAPDCIFCANMIHIAPWEAALGLLTGARALLAPSGGELLLYGPFRRDGRHISDSNVAFDESLRQRDPSWGVRDLEQDVVPAAERAGLALRACIDMPANNMIVCFSPAQPA